MKTNYFFFAGFDPFLQNTSSSSGLAEPGGLERDSAAATTGIVNPDISAIVRNSNTNIIGFESVLHNFGSGSVAADNGGLR